jgi:hypothetical protein
MGLEGCAAESEGVAAGPDCGNRGVRACGGTSAKTSRPAALSAIGATA